MDVDELYDPVRTVYHRKVAGRFTGRPKARREIAMGLGFLALAAVFIGVFIGYDASHQLKWLWGYIVGFKFAILAANFPIRGSAGWLESHGK